MRKPANFLNVAEWIACKLQDVEPPKKLVGGAYSALLRWFPWLLIFSLHPSPGIIFPHVSCSKVMPRGLYGGKPRGNCCRSWQQESKIGKQTFWRKVEEAHRN
jgi:hypothetical protein